jgi:hypothetical protein
VLQGKLSALSIIHIKNNKLHNLFDDIIHDFAVLNHERKCFKFYMMCKKKWQHKYAELLPFSKC